MKLKSKLADSSKSFSMKNAGSNIILSVAKNEAYSAIN
jgi:hypothetical protein